MTFGEKIVHFRGKKKITQKALAEILGITPTRLNYWEKDKREPDVEMIKKLADALEVSANVLIGIDEEETKKAPAPEGTEAVSRERSDRLYDALVAAGLIVEDDLVPQDIEFLGRVVDLIDVWFARKHGE